MKKTIPFLVIPIIIIAAITGCTSMDKEFLQDENNFTDLEPLKLESGYEPYDLRIDIARRTRKEEIAGKEESKRITLELPYTPIGFNIGNGVFIDTNFNVCLNVHELFMIEDEADFIISRKFTNALVKPQRFIKESGHFELLIGASKDEKISIDFEEEQISISRRPGGNSVIEWEDDELSISPVGVLKVIETHAVIGEEDEYRVKKPLKKIYVTLDDEEITFGNIFTVTHIGNMMIFKYDDGREFRLIRIEDDIYFFNEVYSGFHIAREGNTIAVTKEKRDMYQFTLE